MQNKICRSNLNHAACSEQNHNGSIEAITLFEHNWNFPLSPAVLPKFAKCSVVPSLAPYTL